MNEAEERFAKVALLINDYNEEMDALLKSVQGQRDAIKEKWRKSLNILLEDYQES